VSFEIERLSRKLSVRLKLALTDTHTHTHTLAHTIQTHSCMQADTLTLTFAHALAHMCAGGGRASASWRRPSWAFYSSDKPNIHVLPPIHC
jgi:hypothetical protein